MSAKRTIGVLVTAALAMTGLVSQAQAAPSFKDARAARHVADRSLATTLQNVRRGNVDVAKAGVRKTDRLEAKAARISRRAGPRRSAAARSRQLRSAADGVDRGFDGYADLLADAPPSLQGSLIEGLGDLGDLRDQLIGQLSGLLDDLSAGQQTQILDAITAFESDGDIDALLAALADPDLSAAIQAQLEELLGSLSADLQGQIDDLGGLLPAGGLDDLDAFIDQISGTLDDILGGLIDDGGDLVVPGDDCADLVPLFEELGIELPAGFCG